MPSVVRGCSLVAWRRWRRRAATSSAGACSTNCVTTCGLPYRLAQRTPALTATTLLALAIGIGASSAIFAVINGILLKPLPYREPDRLVMVWSESPRDGGRENTISPADYLDFAARTRTLERLEGYFSFLSTLEVGISDRTEVAYAQVATSGLFELLGRPAALGRTFRTDSYAPDVVLSDGYWRRRLAPTAPVIGRAITVGNQPGTIVGVMPPDVVFPYPGMLGPSGFTRVTNVDLWVSMAFAGPMAVAQRTVDARGQVPRGVRFLGAIGRTRPGVSPAQVQANLASVAGELAGASPPATPAGVSSCAPRATRLSARSGPPCCCCSPASGSSCSWRRSTWRT